jgi:hypothetical protein
MASTDIPSSSFTTAIHPRFHTAPQTEIWCVPVRPTVNSFQFFFIHNFCSKIQFLLCRNVETPFRDAGTCVLVV